jgi:hypothetical protein
MIPHSYQAMSKTVATTRLRHRCYIFNSLRMSVMLQGRIHRAGRLPLLLRPIPRMLPTCHKAYESLIANRMQQPNRLL